MNEVKILGGTRFPEGAPKILDSKTKQDPQHAEVTVHEEVVTEDDKTRKNQQQEGEPEVRIRYATSKLQEDE